MVKNNPVKRALKKYKKAPRKDPLQQPNNKAAIMTLSRQVRKLQLAQIGPYQKRLEQVSMDAAHVGSPGFRRNRPVCWRINNFTDQTFFHTVNDTTHETELLARRFLTAPNGFTGTDTKFNPFWGANDCEVSKLRYLPIKCEMVFNFTQKMKVTDMPRWIRIDFLTPRKVIPQSDAHSLNLPEGLYSMGQLIGYPEFSTAIPNKINYTYWRPVMKTQWVKFTPQLSTSDVVINRRFNKTIKFPNEVINVETDTPYSYANDSINTNTPRRTGVWCVINFDHDYDVEDALKFTIQRTIHWRDEHGAAN
ncbi:MAG: putative capsid protein [Circoviridae sp.]|nr:MAG: putative capsid protein [Circoviridae sp.]